MEFRELKYITTIAECGSFTEAASLLYVSQPSLSHMVARVEKRLGVQLFDRSKSPLAPTYAGEVYLRYAEQILSSGELMEHELRDIAQTKKGRLRVGIPYERTAYMIPQITPRFQKEYPGIQIEITDASGGRLLELIERGRIDFAVMPVFMPIPGMESQLICEEELLLSAAPGMITSDDCLNGAPDVVDFARLKDKTFVLQKEGLTIRNAIDLLLGAYGIKPIVSQVISGNMAAYGLSRAGLGVAIVPEITTRLAGQAAPGTLYRLAGKVPVKWEIKVVYRKNAYMGEIENRFIAIAREIFGKSM